MAAAPGDMRVLWFPAVTACLLALILPQIPWAIRNPQLTRTYLSPEVKAIQFVLLAVLIVGLCVFVAVLIAVGLRVLGSLYGRPTTTGVTLATPSGLVGYPRQRIRLVPGDVHVHLVSEPPAGQVYAHGVQRIYLTQQARTLHVVSYTLYDVDSRAHLERWLWKHRVRVVWSGDQEVLPQHRVPPGTHAASWGQTRAYRARANE